MASPASRETNGQNAFCPAQKLTQFRIFEYIEVKNVVLSYSHLYFDNFQADENRTFLPFMRNFIQINHPCQFFKLKQ